MILRLEGRPILSGTGHEAGRALLKEMVETYTGQPIPPLLTTPMGKPYFLNHPIHFSITHTRRHVFCVLSDRPVGIDAEEEDRTVSPRLAEKILSPREWEQYQKAADSDTALLTFWVLKEARAKCTGEGICGYPKHTDFSLQDPRIFRKNGCILAVIEEAPHAV